MRKKYHHLPSIIGKGYKKFWNFKGRYRVVKGSRGSKKSTTISMWIIYNMMKNETGVVAGNIIIMPVYAES